MFSTECEPQLIAEGLGYPHRPLSTSLLPVSFIVIFLFVSFNATESERRTSSKSEFTVEKYLYAPLYIGEKVHLSKLNTDLSNVR
jgi:hypothetical protein